ncbi:glycoside hydrolase family 88 protein [Xanthobacter sp. KR7-65]|uniref:glycoside hydrolase family 88/105 protein n=1 Tax=Xanthobacter sp. KR7-65 TaxID=3156612 RepID=UPI0032B4F753
MPSSLLPVRGSDERNPRSWQQAAFWLGMTWLADRTNDEWVRATIFDLGNRNEWQPGKRTYMADDYSVGMTYLWAAQHGAGEMAIRPLRASFDKVLASPSRVHFAMYKDKATGEWPCVNRWCWADSIFMGPSVWIELSRQTKDPRYRDFAISEFKATKAFLFDPEENLFYRDNRFFGRPEDGGPKIFWARGNGWVIAGLARMLNSLPQDDPDRADIESLFRAMATRLAGLQHPDGFWSPSLLGPAGSPETSGTGLITFALAYGIGHGLLDRVTFEPVVRKGWSALASAVNADGRLGWVQQPAEKPGEVTAASTTPYGAGAFLLAASAIADLNLDAGAPRR